jgi:hypothetical protein
MPDPAYPVRLRREQAERVTCRVEKDTVAIPARLMLRSSRAQGQHHVYRGVQILDGEVEVKLLGNLLVGPVRSPVVVDPLEPESRTGPTGESDVPVTTEAHGHPRQLLVEPGQRLGVVAVESDTPQFGKSHVAISLFVCEGAGGARSMRPLTPP